MFFSLNNFVAAQNPNWIPINYRFLLYPLVGVFPLEFQSASGLSDILNFNLFFMAIGIGYLLPSTVAFSLGIGPIAFGFVAGSIGLFFGFNIRSVAFTPPTMHSYAGYIWAFWRRFFLLDGASTC